MIEDKMIEGAPADKQVRRRPRAAVEEIEVESVAAIRQLNDGAIINVDGVERIVRGKKVTISIKG